MKWISGLKPRFENQVQTWKWNTRKWEAEFQVYFKKSTDRLLLDKFLLEKKNLAGSLLKPK